MPDEPVVPPPPPLPPPHAQPEAPGLSPPPESLPPPEPRKGRVARFGKFSGGCLVVLALAVGIGSAFFQDMHHLFGCAAVQLVYVIPLVAFLLRKRQPAWAYGMILGEAIVLLLASICNGGMDFK